MFNVYHPLWPEFTDSRPKPRQPIYKETTTTNYKITCEVECSFWESINHEHLVRFSGLFHSN